LYIPAVFETMKALSDDGCTPGVVVGRELGGVAVGTALSVVGREEGYWEVSGLLVVGREGEKEFT
jgi:hypothetical protein